MINIYNEDCLQAMRRMDTDQYNLAIVDPPYGINVNISMGRRKGQKKSGYHKYAGADKDIPCKEYFTELFRVSKYQIIWGGNYFIKYLYPTKNIIIWDKLFSNDLSFSAAEIAWSNIDKVSKIFRYAPQTPKRIHPTQKPVALYKWILLNYAKEGDKILDTHLGSGSIAVACHDMGFSLDGYELDTDYYEAACKRLKEHQRQVKLF